MNKDFTIIFEKLDEQAQVEAPEQQGSVVMLSGESFVELDELAELSRVVAEITEPEPLYFTTATAITPSGQPVGSSVGRAPGYPTAKAPACSFERNTMWKESFRKEKITEAVNEQEPVNEVIAGPTPSPVVENVVVPASDPISPFERRLSALEARVAILEKPPVPYGLELPPAGIPVNQVTPPTGALVPKGIHYRDAVCDECQQVHDGTGRTMDTRGKLIKNPKKCSQQ